MILETLGQERRDHVYAGLYMGRSDVALAVRQAALHVWKVIVQNTAKTLREILPVLFELLLGCLASQFSDKRQVCHYISSRMVYVVLYGLILLHTRFEPST